MSQKIGRKAATALALTSSAALLLAGCAGGSQAGGEGGGDGNDRIQVAMMQPPKAALNPFSDDAFKLSRWSTGETLVQLNEDVEIDPMLASEWEQTDDLTWVFTLREDVTFHDGTPLNADAVLNTLQQAADATTPPRALNGVKISSEKTGDYEVTVTTDVPDPPPPQPSGQPAAVNPLRGGVPR